MENDELILDSNSIKSLAHIFFNKYKDTGKEYITQKNALKLIEDVYQSMGIKHYQFKNEGEEFVKIFGINQQHVTYFDIERVFLRYLSKREQSQQTPIKQIDVNFDFLSNLKRQEYQNAVQNHGSQVVKDNLQNAKDLFQRYDLNKDGYLDKNEVLNLVQSTYRILNKQIEISSEEIDKYIELMDKDQDGKISEYDYNMHILQSLKKRDITFQIMNQLSQTNLILQWEIL